MSLKPHIIRFPKIGEPSIGYISVAENEKLPFEVKRVHWAYYTPEEVMRGYHAHYNTEMIIIAVSGKIILNTEMNDGYKSEFILERPNEGVYLPKLCWHTMQYSHNAVQVVLASTFYQQDDYIRDYEKFLRECK